MADITDIFDAPSEKPTGSTSTEIAHQLADEDVPKVSPLVEQANELAHTADQARAAQAAYKIAKQEALAKIEAQLAGLKEAAKEQQAVLDAAAKEMQAAMEEAGVSEIPLYDRKPLRLKTTPGKKKGITLTWLKKHLGDVEKATSIWEAQPKSDPTTEVVIPGPALDERAA